MIVTTDSGKRFGKGTCDGSRIIRFSTKMDELSTPDYNFKNLIGFKEKYYLLGEEAEGVSYDCSKEELVHKLSVYYNVCKHIHKQGEDVKLVVNMPITHYMDVEQRESFRKYFLDDEEIYMTVGRKEYNFNISDVLVVAEGTGIMFSKPDLFKDKSAIICNLGGLNSTCLQTSNRKIIASSVFLGNRGGNILETNIQTSLNKKGYNFQPHEIPFLFKSEREDIRKVVDEECDKTLEGVIRDMKAHNYNLKGCDNVYFEGGTSLILQDKIEKMGFTVVEDPINQDVRGMHKYGVKKLG